LTGDWKKRKAERPYGYQILKLSRAKGRMSRSNCFKVAQ
jgi:hypothetical protein